jgi:hypothetical protein
MNEQEFTNNVSKLVTIYSLVKYKNKYSSDEAMRDSKNPTIDDYLFIEWSTGGVSGGSCWESSDPQPYSTDEPEPEFTDLENVLLSIFPSIPYLQYKAFASLIKEDYRTEYEYYGNSIDYSNKRISLRDIYDKLREFNLV